MRFRLRFSTLVRVTVFATVFATSFASPLAFGAASPFPDVPENHQNVTAITSLKDAKLIKGYDDGSFKPEASISRAEAITIIGKAAGINFDERVNKKIPFSDVPESAWFFPFVQKSFALQKIKGYQDGTFRPMQPVTLPEAVALTLTFFDLSAKDIPLADVQFDGLYDGLEVNAWYGKQMLYAKQRNLFEPDVKGKITAAAPLTRAQLAELVYRMRTVSQTKNAFDITEGWVTTENPENFWKLKHPASWEIFKGQKNSVLWKKSNGSVFFSRLWPDGVKVSISVVENPEGVSSSQFFTRLQATYSEQYAGAKIAFRTTTLSGRPGYIIEIPSERIFDAAVELPNNQFLVFNGEYGSAAIGKFLKKQLETAIFTYQFVEAPPIPPLPPLGERMERLRETILVADGWKEISPLFPDKNLFQTDAIGIGKGPVDYYYSQEANYTIKLERNSSTILNIREGKTDAF